MFTLEDVLVGAADGDGARVEAARFAGVVFGGAAIDSRLVGPGELFVALRGEQHDGHQYLPAAFERGARAALVRRDALDSLALDNVIVLEPTDLPDTVALNPDQRLLIATGDTLAALHRIARKHREKFSPHLIGITGSVGKTSTKEAVGAVLAQHFTTLKTPRSYNSESTMPLTILQLGPEHEAAVIEMGTYGPGEIALLASIAQPQIGIVTNVGPSHMERMGSIETIAQAEGEVIDALPDDGIAILNYDDDRVRAMTSRTNARPFFFGLNPNADLWADKVVSHGFNGITLQAHYQGDAIELALPLMGKHHAYTALAASAAGLVLGLNWAEIAAGLKTCGERLRFITRPGPAGSTILDDTYNASPVSCNAALDLLAEMNGRRIAVFGDMYELGPVEEEAHRIVGAHAAQTADALYLVGERVHWIAEEARVHNPTLEIHQAPDTQALATLLKPALKANDFVLVKGARGREMETVVAALCEAE
ncbi:MAG TPA: UDP-N-acetylmuramoyl-tripeptide--D-alanyl-D-alanine ligase [Nitrolancea sp.]|nr:UDP-N-acetylmuramoyl-tripeptide--D-alanyl-D-alanine ligase [Nitrolancea sp.]